ncbi:MAG: pantetheine-phosphate adenylyltransferase [Deltaproteobacteria bacterium]|nr:pantetheine-phosphate adenylyltransferase [Deltaproteobacteria bacterium]
MVASAIYPGSFDPLTNGHIDVINRCATVFDKVIVAVAGNIKKTSLFTVEERMEMIREAMAGRTGIEVDAFDGLLVEYAKSKKAGAILRGLRAVSDFDYEFQMANMNRKLEPDVVTFFVMTGEGHFYVSSQTVKEVVALGGSVDGLVPPGVSRRLRERFSRKGK